MAPARLSRSTIRASRSGTQSRKSGEPLVVRTPFVSTRSLWAIGSPNRGPTAAPRARVRSASRACSSGRSGSSVTMAFTIGLTRSIRSSWARITSSAETSRVRIERARSLALALHRSDEDMAVEFNTGASPAATLVFVPTVHIRGGPIVPVFVGHRGDCPGVTVGPRHAQGCRMTFAASWVAIAAKASWMFVSGKVWLISVSSRSERSITCMSSGNRLRL